MAETTMPATEADVASVDGTEQNSYELAFHILPTVAEGEVSGAFDTLKASVTQAGGEIFSEEAPERIDLAYEIVKHTEGANKKYGSAYFGWMRFRVESDKIEGIQESVDSNSSVLRHLIIKLTKVEEAYPFRYHEHKNADKKADMIEEEGVSAEDVLADPLLGSEGTDTAEPAKKSGEAKPDSVEENT
jgi:ribosomal protein S6